MSDFLRTLADKLDSFDGWTAFFIYVFVAYIICVFVVMLILFFVDRVRIKKESEYKGRQIQVLNKRIAILQRRVESYQELDYENMKKVHGIKIKENK